MFVLKIHVCGMLQLFMFSSLLRFREACNIAYRHCVQYISAWQTYPRRELRSAAEGTSSPTCFVPT